MQDEERAVQVARPSPVVRNPITEPDTLTEQDPVMTWREQRITALGYLPEIAEVCALAEVDWHALERLIVSGCDLDLAIRILA